MTKIANLVLAALLGGCGAGDSPGGGGGNVGFGGAQDLGELRGILDQGDIPGEATLDANGFFSEHYSEQPVADCGQPLCPHGMLAVGQDWMTGAYQAVIQIGMNTPIDPATLPRKPLDLVVVVDTSGSMAEDGRLTYVKQGLQLLVDQLEDGDRLAVVSYADAVTVRRDLVALDRPSLHAAVAALVAAGATNLYDGLAAGLAIADANRDLGRQSRVMLLSDGLPTVGVLDDAAIIALAEPTIARGTGLTTIGVGAEFNVDLMRGLAERGAGNFYFLESPSAVAEVFGEELATFVTPLALEVKLEVVTTPAYTVDEVIGTHLWLAEGNTGSIDLPAVFLASRTGAKPGEGRRGAGSSLFLRLTPTAADRWGDAPNRMALIRLSYHLPGSTERIEQTVTVDNPRLPGEAPNEVYLSDQAMRAHYAMYNVYLGLREATREAAWSYGCALAQLHRLADATRTWNAEANDPDLAADLELIAEFERNLVTAGAVDDLDPDTCATDMSYPPDGRYAEGCRAGGGAGGGGALLVALALLAARRRRYP